MKTISPPKLEANDEVRVIAPARSMSIISEETKRIAINALEKMGLKLTFSGPHFSTFGCLKGMDYITQYFKECLFMTDPVNLTSSAQWSDDEWYLDQENRTFLDNHGMTTINVGRATGTIIGGNLCTLNLLHGTAYMPDLKGSILFIEDDYLVFPEIFDRDLQSLIMQEGFSEIKGLVIGRFQEASKMTTDALLSICSNKREFDNIPILANADFGHTMPMFTFPIGGMCELDTTCKKPSLILKWADL